MVFSSHIETISKKRTKIFQINNFGRMQGISNFKMDLFISLLSLFISLNTIKGNFIFDEVCMGETFEPECNGHSTILIKSARIGRMKYGKCLGEETGPIGCSENVEGYLDSECFGKLACSIYVIDRALMAANPCSAQYAAYLEVVYECVAGNADLSKVFFFFIRCSVVYG